MKNIKIILFLFSIIFTNINAQELTIASFNIRYDNKGDADQGNGWAQRCPVVSSLIEFHDFDIVGTQEVLHNQLNDMLAFLPEYSYIGVGREDGKTKGEYAPIFYKKDKFKVLQSGHFWLSEQTDYPNKGWDAVLPRICTWIQLQPVNSSKSVWFFNLHMDHRGVLARKESAKLVLNKIKEMCGNEIVILTGDFNVDQTHESYAVLHDSGILSDSYEMAKKRYALNGTFNRFEPDSFTTSRIDHIFISPCVEVKRYGVLTDSYRSGDVNADDIVSSSFPEEVSFKKYTTRMPSDHFPIMIKIDLE